MEMRIPEVKTYRILWPEFDPIDDLKKKMAAKRGSNNSRNNTRGGFNNLILMMSKTSRILMRIICK